MENKKNIDSKELTEFLNDINSEKVAEFRNDINSEKVAEFRNDINSEKVAEFRNDIKSNELVNIPYNIDKEFSIKKIVDDIFPFIVHIRRQIHQNPELSEKEFLTKELILRYLKEFDIDYIEYDRNNAVTGFIDIGASKTIAIRADMDALPITENLNHSYISKNKGVMHACGHDAHTAILLGTCKALSILKNRLNVNVKFFFEPAEETIGGAKFMIADGCMENPIVDCVFGYHVDPNIEAKKIGIKYGILNACSELINLEVIGKKSHAAYPHMGTDAIVIAGNIITALQTISSRNIDPFNPIALSFGTINGGLRENIVCDNVKIKGTLRCIDTSVKDNVKNRIVEICDCISKGLGGSAKVEFTESYPILKNCEKIVDYIKNNANCLLGEENVIIKENASLGTEDFSYFLQKTKGAFIQIGCANYEKKINSPLHSSSFDIDEECLKTGVMINLINVLNYRI
ncbi:MAG: amidohydrolase [Clostridioides sp.]|jgi:amidohydrolase|nr:amidohydrolase [Clostridioides sp.]